MKPIVFNSAWYLPHENRGQVLAWSDVGKLIIRQDRLLFRGKNQTVEITDINKISYGKQGTDWVNNWVRIDYQDDRVAYFADGRCFGYAGLFGGTKKLYLAARTRCHAKPTISPPKLAQPNTTMALTIRNENEDDCRRVEEITKKAFWNLHFPGCDEHYLAHILRGHEDFVGELNFVIEVNGQVVGSIMYAKAWLVGEDGRRIDILTFGPVCILPEFQRQGLGGKLIRHSMEKARELGYGAIVIFGNPGNYVGLGFKSCARHNVQLGNGTFPTALLVKELEADFFDGSKWTYEGSSVYMFDRQAAKEFDADFEQMEPKETPHQEEFFILSQSTINLQ